VAILGSGRAVLAESHVGFIAKACRSLLIPRKARAGRAHVCNEANAVDTAAQKPLVNINENTSAAAARWA
jgi:hypothetical protein